MKLVYKLNCYFFLYLFNKDERLGALEISSDSSSFSTSSPSPSSSEDELFSSSFESSFSEINYP